jgi:hypothetical protein
MQCDVSLRVLHYTHCWQSIPGYRFAAQDHGTKPQQHSQPCMRMLFIVVCDMDSNDTRSGAPTANLANKNQEIKLLQSRKFIVLFCFSRAWSVRTRPLLPAEAVRLRAKAGKLGGCGAASTAATL